MFGGLEREIGFRTVFGGKGLAEGGGGGGAPRHGPRKILTGPCIGPSEVRCHNNRLGLNVGLPGALIALPPRIPFWMLRGPVTMEPSSLPISFLPANHPHPHPLIDLLMMTMEKEKKKSQPMHMLHPAPPPPPPTSSSNASQKWSHNWDLMTNG